MSELFCWGWITSRGVIAGLVEAEGLPDLSIQIDDTSIAADVKHLYAASSKSRVRKVIKKANSQIKRADLEGAGLVFLTIDRHPHRESLDDRVPSDVREVIGEVARELFSGSSRSVAHVIVIWDEVMLLGEPPDPVAVFLRRRSTSVTHPQPRRVFELTEELLPVFTLAFRVTYPESSNERIEHDPAPVISDRVLVAATFREQHNFAHGIRPSHVTEVLSDPDISIPLQLPSGADLTLVTRRIALPSSRTYTCLIVSRKLADDSIEATVGFRLYDDESRELWLDPVAAFLEALDRWGLPVQIGPHEGLFIPYVELDRSGGDEADSAVVVQAPAKEDYLIAAQIRLDNHPPKATFAAVYAINLSSYRRDVSASRLI
jgi:hypothetical protein